MVRRGLVWTGRVRLGKARQGKGYFKTKRETHDRRIRGLVRETALRNHCGGLGRFERPTYATTGLRLSRIALTPELQSISDYTVPRRICLTRKFRGASHTIFAGFAPL